MNKQHLIEAINYLPDDAVITDNIGIGKDCYDISYIEIRFSVGISLHEVKLMLFVPEV